MSALCSALAWRAALTALVAAAALALIVVAASGHVQTVTPTKTTVNRSGTLKSKGCAARHQARKPPLRRAAIHHRPNGSAFQSSDHMNYFRVPREPL